MSQLAVAAYRPIVIVTTIYTRTSTEWNSSPNSRILSSKSGSETISLPSIGVDDVLRDRLEDAGLDRNVAFLFKMNNL